MFAQNRLKTTPRLVINNQTLFKYRFRLNFHHFFFYSCEIDAKSIYSTTCNLMIDEGNCQNCRKDKTSCKDTYIEIDFIYKICFLLILMDYMSKC